MRGDRRGRKILAQYCPTIRYMELVTEMGLKPEGGRVPLDFGIRVRVESEKLPGSPPLMEEILIRSFHAILHFG